MLSWPFYVVWNFLPETSSWGVYAVVTVCTPFLLLVNAFTALITFGGIILFPFSGSLTILIWVGVGIFLFVFTLLMSILGGLGYLTAGATPTT